MRAGIWAVDNFAQAQQSNQYFRYPGMDVSGSTGTNYMHAGPWYKNHSAAL